jgi:pyridoxine 4-dehydrogenase
MSWLASFWVAGLTRTCSMKRARVWPASSRRASAHHRDVLAHALSIGVTRLDTAYNYLRFGSHRMLAATIEDLVGCFAVSTKVGFFPVGHSAEHSLDPARLRGAVRESVDTLGIVPDVVFLHSPERSLTGLDVPAAAERLAAAAGVIGELAAAGWCNRWGIATWDPRPLAHIVGAQDADVVAPEVLMVRAGFLVPAGVLAAAEQLADRFAVRAENRWGMSPFAGRDTDPVWEAVYPRAFLAPTVRCSPVQAAFAAAYAITEVHWLVVGTDQPAHLDQLVAASLLPLDQEAIADYRRRLTQAAAGTRVAAS